MLKLSHRGSAKSDSSITSNTSPERTDWFFTIFCSHLPIFLTSYSSSSSSLSSPSSVLYLFRQLFYSCSLFGISFSFFGFCFFAFELWQLLHWLCYGIFVQSRFACGIKANQSIAVDGFKRVFERERTGVEFQGRRIRLRSHIGIYWNWTLKKCPKLNSVHVLLRIVITGRHLVMFIN